VTLALVLAAIPNQAPASWGGVAMSVAALGLLGGLLLVWSRRSGWGREHVLLAAAGPPWWPPWPPPSSSLTPWGMRHQRSGT
jgi:hypothetical protein